MTKTLLIVWGSIVTILFVCLLAIYLDREGIVEFRKESNVDYYYPSDLKSMHLPTWELTNSIPLSPDSAIRAALGYVKTKHPGIGDWDIDRATLEKTGVDGIWDYQVELTDRKSGNYNLALVRVLMDGSIWEPTSKKRN